MPPKSPAVIAGLMLSAVVAAQDLTASSLGIVYDVDDLNSRALARYYAGRRSIPAENLVGVHAGHAAEMPPEAFAALRAEVLHRLPTSVQSLAILWSRPYAVGCMSVTSAMAAGYRPAYCNPGCVDTPRNPLFDEPEWLPADTVGWWPAMLLPTDDPALARSLIDRGVAADGSRPAGTLYLVRTRDSRRNVRAETYGDARSLLETRLVVRELETPVEGTVPDAIGYFTGVAVVAELSRIRFRPGAVADHLTSSGGVLEGGNQMSIIAWIRQGATASYGSVSEPCNILGKFPDVGVLMRHYLRGDSVLEAYWKSVAMPGQGLFVGEPLSRPYRHE